MSEVIRDAVVRLRIEMQKAKLESPELAQITRAYGEQSKAAQEAVRATNEIHRATKESVRSVEEYGKSVQEYVGGTSIHWANSATESRKAMTQILSHTTEGLEGFTRFTRGVMLFGSTNEKEMHELLMRMIKLQAGFDVVAGGAKLVKGLGLAFGTTGMAAAGVTLALTAGITAWEMWKAKAESAKKAAEDARLEMEKLSAGVRKIGFQAGDRERERDALLIKNAITPEQRAAAEARARENLQIQIRANDAYYQKEAPAFFGSSQNFQHGMKGLIHRPDQLRDQAMKARDYEGERSKLLALQLEQERQIYEIQREQLSTHNSLAAAGFGSAAEIMAQFPGGGLGASMATQAGNQTVNKANATMEKFIAEQTKSLETITGAYTRAVERIKQLEIELDGAHVK